jgi:hypothetical protein
MTFNQKSRNFLSIPMGISMGIHSLLVAGLIFLFWEKPAPKPKMPPIEITHIKLEQRKAITPKENEKPVKGNPRPLKASQSFQPALHLVSKVSIPVKPITTALKNINTIIKK